MTDYFVNLAITNAVSITLLAAVAVALSLVWKQPRFTHALWIIVQLKFLVPPVVTLGLIALPLGRELPQFAPKSSGPPAVEHRPGKTHDESSGFTGQPLTADRGESLTNASPILSTAVIAELSSPEQRVTEMLQSGEAEQAWAATPRDSNSYFGNWKAWFLSTWVAGIAILSCVTAARLRRFRRLIQLMAPADGLLRADVDVVARQISLARSPETRVISECMIPFVAAIGRPVLVLPQVITTWQTDERQAVIAHELAHIRRRDHVVRWLETIVRHTFWWHPVVYFASARINRAAELCCDAMVLARFRADSSRGIASSYAAAMLNVINLGDQAALPPAIGSLAFGDGRFLVRRFEMILAKPAYQALPVKLRTLLAAIALVLPLSFATITVAPNVAISDEASPGTVAAAHVAVPNATLSAPDSEEAGAGKLLDDTVTEVTNKFQAMKTAIARKEAAKRQCDSLLAGYAQGNVTMDIVLDAQRRLADAEVEYVQALLGSESTTPSDAVRARLLLELQSFRNGRDSALAAWQLTHALWSSGARKDSAQDLAQAKEQYFLFRAQMENKQMEIARIDSRAKHVRM